MGDYAVDLILKGESNLVVCEHNGKLVETEIKYALMLDRMYKNKLKDGDLDSFTEAQVAEMKAFCEAKHADFSDMLDVAKTLALN